MKNKEKTVTLLTPEGEELMRSDRGTVPWNEYPRPRMERDSFLCLNGEWDFSVCKKGETPTYNEKIKVPFVPESVLSGIGRAMPEDAVLCYRRALRLPSGFVKGRTLLHVGAADQIAEVFLNGERLGKHTGGYGSFSFDVTRLLKEENILEISVTDRLDDKLLPYGKQCRKRGGMWYTPVSGIWQTVWLESLPERYISDLKEPSREIYIRSENNRRRRGSGRGGRYERRHGGAGLGCAPHSRMR